MGESLGYSPRDRLARIIRPDWSRTVAAPASADAPESARLIAADAVVVLVSAKDKQTTSGGGRIVLVALPPAAANTVAGAALVQSVTLTLH